MKRLTILHLPKLYTTVQNSNYIENLHRLCPRLEEIGFTIDEDVASLPINEVFRNSKTL